jgi:(p)ppGpp synthase/HD superfamily hydrolase
MTLILKALNFSKEKHQGQIRKGSGVEYVTHPIAVSYLVASYKKSKHLEELIVASMLHDTIEDTDATFIEIATTFTPLVASLVLELSNDSEQIKTMGKLEYQKKKTVGMSSYGLLIKLADRLHNVSDQPSVKMISDTIELIDNLKKNRKLSKTHKLIIVDILKICNSVV